jgi:hypothetical protein
VLRSVCAAEIPKVVHTVEAVPGQTIGSGLFFDFFGAQVFGTWLFRKPVFRTLAFGAQVFGARGRRAKRS